MMSNQAMKEVARYDYKTKDGHVVGHVSRLEEVNSAEPKPHKKTIPHFKPGGQSGIPEDLPGEHRLFGLESINDYAEPVYFVEGEKCAAALHSLGLQAITSLGGANSAKKAVWKALEGIQYALLFPDKDEPGLSYMADVYQALRRLDSRPKAYLVSLPDLPPKGDICDYLSALKPLSEWNQISPIAPDSAIKAVREELIRSCEENLKEPPVEWRYISANSAKLRAITWRDFMALKIAPRKALLAPWLMEASINMVFADRGVGKTYFSLGCASALATGKSFLKYEAEEPISVLYLDGEMQAQLMQQRLASFMGDEMAKFMLVTPDFQPTGEMPDLGTSGGMKAIDDLIEKTDPKVIFVDNLSTFIRTGNENEGESWLPVQNWAVKHRSKGRALVFVHHTNKEGKQRGSHRKEDVMDTVINLKRPDDYLSGQEGARFVVHFTKNRCLPAEDIKDIEAVLKPLESGSEWSWQYSESGYELAAKLLKSGFSQNEVAEELGVTKGTISKWKQKAREARLL